MKDMELKTNYQYTYFIYPYIVKQEYGDRYKNGSSVAAGYYVCTNEDGNCTLLPLEDWFSRR